ncbi:glycosyltransferase [Selenomonas sp. AB3002]|uniref:glycosyltransferase n=1 Tax=Selenomonas sp. AB3002 TaxID=1392502 RepID=UPI000496DBC3
MIYLFPFDKVPQGSKVILHGSENILVQFLGQLTSSGYAKVVAVSVKEQEDGGLPESALERLGRSDYDLLVIAAEDGTAGSRMAEQLVESGIKRERIVLSSPRPVLRYHKINRPGSSTMRNFDVMLYLFPFELVRPGSRVIIYGAGDVCRQFLAQLEVVPYCKVEAVADKNTDYRSEAVRLITPDKIQEEAYDAVVIAINEERIVEAVRKDLLAWRVPEAKIIDASWRTLPDENGMLNLLSSGHWEVLENAASKEPKLEDYSTDPADFIGALAASRWGQPWQEIADYVSGLPLGRRKSKDHQEDLTVAIYYRSLANGGAQRVTAMLASLWAEARQENGAPLYRVVLVLDQATAGKEAEYPLSEQVERVYLPSPEEASGENYAQRCRAWQEMLAQYAVDVVVYAWLHHEAVIWDWLSIKSHPLHPAFVLQSHEFCCMPYTRMDGLASNLLTMYSLADGCVVLSEYDREFVGSFAPHTYCIPNPIPFSTGTTPNSSYEQDLIIWVGRLSPEKQPLEAVRMIYLLRKRGRQAKLCMIGEDSDLSLSKLRQEIKLLGLEDSVELVGFTMDVEQYYRRASIFLSTSLYEGFPLAMAEAFAHGLPVVAYELPWLSMAENNEGLLSVPQGRPELLAAEIDKLLKFPRLAQELGAKGKSHLADLEKTDIAASWREVFSAVTSEEEGRGEASNAMSMLFRYITSYQQMAKERLQKRCQEEMELLRLEAQEHSASAALGMPVENYLPARHSESSAAMRKYKRWFFPEHGFREGARLVVYGYGDMGKDYAWQIRHGRRFLLAGIVAEKPAEYAGEAEVLPPEALMEMEFDIVLIAAEEAEAAEKIRRSLRQLGVDKERVYWQDVRLGLEGEA